MIKAILFDLDGTLLSLDMRLFFKLYFDELAKHAAAAGFEPVSFIKALHYGTDKMLANDGSSTNEQVYWKAFAEKFGSAGEKEQKVFMDYYLGRYTQTVNASSSKSDAAVDIVKTLKKKGYPLAIATNPLFPIEAVIVRMQAGGLDPNDFEYITTYDNSNSAKPTADYFLSVAKAMNTPEQDCLMVGNDTSDDMPAAECGMQTYLVTDGLINEKNFDLSEFQHGTLLEFQDFVSKLPDLK